MIPYTPGGKGDPPSQGVISSQRPEGGSRTNEGEGRGGREGKVIECGP